MIREAAVAGRYRKMDRRDFPQIQIFTIADYFDGKQPELPPTIETARKRAQADGGEQQSFIAIP